MISYLICLNNSPFCSKYNGELDLVQFDVARCVLLYLCTLKVPGPLLCRIIPIIVYLHTAPEMMQKTLHFKLCECQRFINKHVAKCGETIDTVTSGGVSISSERDTRYFVFCWVNHKVNERNHDFTHTHARLRSNTLIQSSTCTRPIVDFPLYYYSWLFSREQ
jgi:hypothetical protein